MTGGGVDSLRQAAMRGLVPGMKELETGAEAMRLGKLPVSVSSYNVDVFDMSDKSDRSRYAELMLGMFPNLQAAKTVIWRNELCVMTRADGSTTWMRYMEWSDYVITRPDGLKDIKTGADDGVNDDGV